MRKCSGNNTQSWGFDSIFDVECPNCGYTVEFFMDEISRNCPKCRQKVVTTRKNSGCGQQCSSSSPHMRNLCSNFIRSKQRFVGNYLETYVNVQE